MNTLVVVQEVGQKIFLIRGQRVMLDRDLAALYGITTFNLKKAVRRNKERFPADFMLRLTTEEYAALRFQIGILKRGRHAKYLPSAFTEQGVAMLSSVLRSKRAIQVNIAIMRVFVRMRQVLAGHKELAGRLEAVERHLAGHDIALGEHASEILAVFKALRRLMAPPVKPRPRIGFQPPVP